MLFKEQSKPYFVAEVNTSHFGNLENAKRLIVAASDSGADCVKFQSWSPESLYSSAFFSKNRVSERIFEKFSLSESQLRELADYCESLGVAFASTPYSIDELKLLVSLPNVPFIKIASMDAVNLSFLSSVGETGLPIVLSTGMCEMREVQAAVSTLEEAGCTSLCILHCVSLYPHDIKYAAIRNVMGLKIEFPNHVIGYSDHTLGSVAAAAAVALGAQVIEKHLTLDRTKIGFDNQMAAEPYEFAKLVEACQSTFDSLGTFERVVSEREKEQRPTMRRSITVTATLETGQIVTESDLGAFRPGSGFPVSEMSNIVGRKARRRIAAGEQLSEGDLI